MTDGKKEIEEWIGVGRRKTSVASVRVRPGTGKVDINGREFKEYFVQDIQQLTVMSPFKHVSGKGSWDLIVRVRGGGIEAQAEALRLGIARALVERDETLRHEFKELGYMTRDSRKKERKKYGRAGARKRFQFSKR